MSEWSKEADCNSVSSTFEGSNPSRASILKRRWEMHWISVKDKLPKPAEDVLVVVAGEDIRSITTAEYYTFGWVLHDCFFHDKDIVPSYWMPLPKMPNDHE